MHSTNHLGFHLQERRLNPVFPIHLGVMYRCVSIEQQGTQTGGKQEGTFSTNPISLMGGRHGLLQNNGKFETLFEELPLIIKLQNFNTVLLLLLFGFSGCLLYCFLGFFLH